MFTLYAKVFSKSIILLSIMEYHLHPSQSVAVKDSLVSFRHYTRRNTVHYLTLNWRQLQNLNDLILDIDIMKEMRNYPIGGGMWLTYDYPIIQLRDYERKHIFRFYTRSWQEYIRHAHRQVFSFVRHGKRKRTNNEYDADDESEQPYQSRKSISRLPRRCQILSRSSRNGSYENVKRSKSTIFPRRKDSNSRPRSPIRGGKDAMRISQQIKDDQEDGELSSDEFENGEHGSECSIEEGSVSS